MKHLLILLITVLCYHHSSAKEYNLTLTITSNNALYGYIYDSLGLDNRSWHRSRDHSYNSETQTLSYRFDSLSKGPHTFWMRDVMGFRHSLSFNLQRDTLIRFDKYMSYRPEKLITAEEMQQQLPVYLIYTTETKEASTSEQPC